MAEKRRYKIYILHENLMRYLGDQEETSALRFQGKLVLSFKRLLIDSERTVVVNFVASTLGLNVYGLWRETMFHPVTEIFNKRKIK